MKMLRWVLVLALLGCGGGGKAPGSSVSKTPLTVQVLREDVKAKIGPAGGVLDVEHDHRRYHLVIPAGALTVETEIGMAPALIRELPSFVGVRLQPDGLVLATAATLAVSPRPSGTLPRFSLSYTEASQRASWDVVIPTKDSETLWLRGFSAHGSVPANEVALFTTPEERAALAGGLTESDDEWALAARVLGRLYESQVAPLVAAAGGSAGPFLAAARAFNLWSACIGDPQVTRSAHHEGASETIAVLRDRAEEELSVAGAKVLQRISRPACAADPAVIAPKDWVTVPQEITAMLGKYGRSVPSFTPCASLELTLEGNRSLASDQATVSFSASFALVDPRGGREPTDALISVSDVVGAQGPGRVDAPAGRAQVVLQRTLGPERRRVVTATVTARALLSELGAIPEGQPVQFLAAEPGNLVLVTAEPRVISDPATRSLVCAKAFRDGVVMAQTAAVFSRPLLGAFTGAPGDPLGCVTYVPPVPLPAEVTRVTLQAEMKIGSELVTGTTEITLNPGQVDLTIDATPTRLAPGQTSKICILAKSGGVPVASYTAKLTASLPGVLDSDDLVVSSADGLGCITITAPSGSSSNPATLRVEAAVTANGVLATVGLTLDLLPGAIYAGTVGANGHCDFPAGPPMSVSCSGQVRSCQGTSSGDDMLSATIRIESFNSDRMMLVVSGYQRMGSSVSSKCAGVPFRMVESATSNPRSAELLASSGGSFELRFACDVRVTETSFDECGGNPLTDVTNDPLGMCSLLLTPEPAGAAVPDRFVLSPSTLSCSGSMTGALVRVD